MSAVTQATALFDRPIAIQHRMDGAFGGDGNSREPALEMFVDFASTPAGVLVFHIRDVILDPKWKPVGLTIWMPALIREPAQATPPITIKYLVADFTGDIKLPAKFRHRLTG
jgi:hypothetical protein